MIVMGTSLILVSAGGHIAGSSSFFASVCQFNEHRRMISSRVLLKRFEYTEKNLDNVEDGMLNPSEIDARVTASF